MYKEKIILIGKYPPIISLLEATTYVSVSKKVLSNDFLSYNYDGGYNLYDGKNLFLFRNLDHIEKIIRLVSINLKYFEQIIIEYINKVEKLKISEVDSLNVHTLENFGKSLVFQSLPYAFEQIYQISNLKNKDIDNMLIRLAELRSKADLVQKDNEIWFRSQIENISSKLESDVNFVTYYELLQILTSGIVDKNYKKEVEKRKKNYLLDYNSPLTKQKDQFLIHYSSDKIYHWLYSYISGKTDNNLTKQTFYGKILSKGLVRGSLYNYTKNNISLIPPNCIIIADYIDLHDMEIISNISPKAIVVEKAAITSHISIHARELKIPVIIVENIYNNLKDGDMIEVDADNGVVRIIK